MTGNVSFLLFDWLKHAFKCMAYHPLILIPSSSDESSWKRATELLVEVATHGEATGYEVPCLMVSAKDDLDSFPICIQESTRVGFLLIS